MATRLNLDNQTFAQLVRFALVGFFLAGVYSAIYWYLATYVMPPVAAVVVAFLVSVSIGFVLHSRWSFRGHGRREDHRLVLEAVARPDLADGNAHITPRSASAASSASERPSSSP